MTGGRGRLMGSVAMAIAAILGSLGPGAAASADDRARRPAEDEFACPVTQPVAGDFTPSAGYPATSPFDGTVWFGTPELWTSLRPDGGGWITKMLLWWSTEYPGGASEPQPDVDVTWTYLGPGQPRWSLVSVGDWTTNADTDESGWLMMAGTYPRFVVPGVMPIAGGCWRVEATYRDASVSYVVDVPWERPEG